MILNIYLKKYGLASRSGGLWDSALPYKPLSLVIMAGEVIIK